jgi:hypothetical protein
MSRHALERIHLSVEHLRSITWLATHDDLGSFLFATFFFAVL